MKKNKLAKIAFAMLALTMTAGCGSNAATPTQTPTEAAAKSGNNSGGSAKTDETTTAAGGSTLKIWMPWTSTTILSPSESMAWQEAAKATGVTIEFEAPPAGQEAEAFSLMLASGEYPDIIKDQGYRGGGLKAVKDGVYLKLNDYLDTQLPYYKAATDLSPTISKQVREDDGTIWSFKMIQTFEEPSWAGPAIRKDYLDQTNQPMPVTIDDWHTVLTAFKEQLNIEVPMLLNIGRLNNSSAFMSAFEGANNNFINKDGTVLYGPIQPGFKEWLALMNQWYSEGLIDKDFATRDGKSEEAYISNGKSGSAATLYYGEFPQYIQAGKGASEAYDLQPVSYPVAKAGDRAEDLKLGNKNWEVRGNDVVISAQSKNIDAALKLMDYWYSDEGFMLGNYGIEGYSYIWVDGAAEFMNGAPFFPPGLAGRIKTQHPEFSAEVIDQTTGSLLPWEKYKLGNDAYLRNPLCYIKDEIIIAAMEEWNKPAKTYNIPPLSQTEDESKKVSDIMTPLNTYKDEMIYKFINGDEPISNFDTYVEHIKSMGIDEVTQIKQTQLDRYINR